MYGRLKFDNDSSTSPDTVIHATNPEFERSYAMIDDDHGTEAKARKEYVSSLSTSEFEIYDFTPKIVDSVVDYDYETPYWAPADKRKDLLSQFKKLRIRSVAENDIE